MASEKEKYEAFSNIRNVLPDFDGKMWYQLSHLRMLSFMIFIIALTSTNNGYDGSMFNGLYALKSFNNAIGNVNGAVLGALTNGMNFGYFIAFFAAPWLVDNLGRKWSLHVSNIIMVCAVIIQSFSGAWIKSMPDDYTKKDIFGMLLGARIILGFGAGIGAVAAPTLMSEIAYPTHREASTTFYNCCWYLGAVIASWVSYGCRNIDNDWNWRAVTVVQGFFPLLQSILIPFIVAESPRFLISKGKLEEARQILEKYHGGGYPGADALIDYEMTEIRMAIMQEKESMKTASYMDFIRTKANRKRLWLICWVSVFMQLSGNGLVSYYLAKVLDSIGITSVNEQLVVNAGLMIYNLGIACIITFFIIPRIRRRLAFIVSSTGMLFCFVLWTILSAINQERDFKDKSLAKGVLVMIFIFYLFYNLGLNGLPATYTTEILPYSLRASGVNIYQIVQQFASIYNGFVNSIAMEAIEWKYYIVYCCILGVECVIIYFTFIETSGRTLEEVALVLGDGVVDLSDTTPPTVNNDSKPKVVETA
ncbi:DEKNAAC103209 [Brettanomyces naardenensis]|uniref:DEKNAAC103209 n=1 Tax=Brettanomyces naardenensis TaxID=13370 RepID=A0A448YMN9_BRENA|nr:DEKNAAC103209 [Brettanomyces naardenensis]